MCKCTPSTPRAPPNSARINCQESFLAGRAIFGGGSGSFSSFRPLLQATIKKVNFWRKKSAPQTKSWLRLCRLLSSRNLVRTLVDTYLGYLNLSILPITYVSANPQTIILLIIIHSPATTVCMERQSLGWHRENSPLLKGAYSIHCADLDDRKHELHSESKKTVPLQPTYVHNFDNCWPIFKMFITVVFSKLLQTLPKITVLRSLSHRSKVQWEVQPMARIQQQNRPTFVKVINECIGLSICVVIILYMGGKNRQNATFANQSNIS